MIKKHVVILQSISLYSKQEQENIKRNKRKYWRILTKVVEN